MPSTLSLHVFWIVTLAACTTGFAAEIPSAESPPVPPAAATPAAPVAGTEAPEDPLVAAAVRSSNAFGAELYAKLRERPGNVTIAPLGLMRALLPLAAGVQGAAGEELRRGLHLTQSPAEAADGCAALSRRLQRAAGNDSNLTLANALWVQQWNTISNDFIDLIRQHGRSELRVIDFARPEYAAHWMNRWISDRTEDRIPAIADAASYDPRSCIVVANAVYFRTPWAEDFDAAATADASFFPPVEPPKAPPAPVEPQAAAGAGTPNSTGAVSAPAAPGQTVAATPPPSPSRPEAVAVPTMHRVAALRVLARPGFRLFELPYRSEQLSLVVLVPDAETPLARIEAGLDVAMLAELLHGVHVAPAARADLRLPRFRAAQSTVRLDPALRELGMRLVYDHGGAADFTPFGVNPDGAPVYLSAVSQLTKFVVEEKGSAPAPMAVSGDTPTQPVELPAPLAVDRPFLFFVCDQVSGAVLLMGRIVDPRAS